MSVTIIKATLKTQNFRQHKSNPKGNTLIFSRNHPTEKFVRIIVDSGIDQNTQKIVSQPSVSSVYININKHWREIVSAHKGTNLSGLITTVESQAASAAKCKHCSAKKFKAKSGKVVCANACWTNWSGNKTNTTQKSSPKNPPKIKAQKTTQKSSQKIAPKNPSRKTAKKSSQKKEPNYLLDVQPGDLVTVEEITPEGNTIDYNGFILGIVGKVNEDKYKSVLVQWCSNKSALPDYLLPTSRISSGYNNAFRHTRLKVISRKVNWVKE
jgi:uncharacterized Zn finger protein (UPF0148 family)